MLYYDSEDHLLLHRDFSRFKYRCSAVEGAPLGPVSLLELFFTHMVFYSSGPLPPLHGLKRISKRNVL